MLSDNQKLVNFIRNNSQEFKLVVEWLANIKQKTYELITPARFPRDDEGVYRGLGIADQMTKMIREIEHTLQK